MKENWPNYDDTAAFFVLPRVFLAGAGLGSFCDSIRAEVRARAACYGLNEYHHSQTRKVEKTDE